MNISDQKVIISNLSKSFWIGYKKSDGALSRVLSLVIGKESKRPVKILDDISFSVRAGENVGLIGSNGSGKSTLLRIIAEIYQKDAGQIIKHGEIIYINGFGIGLKQRLTMKENIYLIATLMGLTRRQIKKRFAEIVKFSGLEKYINTRVYQFSYGMMSRLGFSTTIHCLEQKNPDIILLDEVFGTGGDLNFQYKALAVMEEFLKGGAAVILVSHDLKFIQKYCDRVIWLKDGRIKQQGKPEEIINAYTADNEKNIA